MAANVLFDTKIGDVRKIDGMPIGSTTPSTGAFTTLSSSGAATLASLGVTGTLTVGGTAQTGPAQAYNHVTTSITSHNMNLTAANITGGWLTVFMDITTTISGQDCTITLPTVAATVAAMSFTPYAGMTYELDIYNDQAGQYNYTLTADSGPTWTLAGTAQTIAYGTVRKYLVTLTSLTAGTMQSLGQFAIGAAP